MYLDNDSSSYLGDLCYGRRIDRMVFLLPATRSLNIVSVQRATKRHIFNDHVLVHSERQGHRHAPMTTLSSAVVRFQNTQVP
jgi:hypothetical protein